MFFIAEFLGQLASRNCLVGGNFHQGLTHHALLNLTRRAEFDDLTCIDDGDAIAKPLGFLYVVSGDQDSAAVFFQLLNKAMNLMPNLGIQPGSRLVEK